MIEIYYGKSNASDIENKESQLVEFFKQKVNKYSDYNSRIVRINAYYELQNILIKKKIPLEFTINSYGKIYLNNNNLYFNLSHSNDYYAFAISKEEVGIDIEKVRDDVNIDLIKRISNSKDEIKDVIKMWTIKESYLKYLGTGINTNLKDILINKNSVSRNGEMLASYYNFKITNELNIYEITLCAKTIDKIKTIEIK